MVFEKRREEFNNGPKKGDFGQELLDVFLFIDFSFRKICCEGDCYD